VIGESRGEAATVEAVTKQVRDLKLRGVDRIDVGFDVSPELIKAIVGEAHRLGLSVSGYPLRAREAIEAGLDAFKHTHTLGRANTDANGIAILTKNLAVGERFRDVHPCVLDGNADALMQLMLSHKTVWIPTLVKDFKAVLPRREEFERDNITLIGNPELGYLPVQDLLLQLTNTSDEGLMQTPCGDIGTYDVTSPDYALFQRSYRQLLQFIGTFVKSGGRVLAGTAPHSFVLPGISLHHEMQLFVDAGLTPTQALQSASLWPAEWMRAQKDIGSVEAGKLADIVVLAKNPLDDIRNTRTVETVIQGGRVLATGYHRSYTNPIPRNSQRSAPSGGYARPELSKIAPLVVIEGSGDVPVRVTGRQFARKSVVLFGGTPIATQFVSETELKAVIPARLVATAGTYWLHVFTQRPGGGDSTPASLIVTFR
jgi:Amidohydrolase family/IPT/TIG domain